MISNTRIFSTLIIVAFLLIISIVIRYTTAADVEATVEIVNVAPAIDSVRFSTSAFGADDLTATGILPSVGNDRTIHINGVISDNNGKNDIATSTLALTFFRTMKKNTCTNDKNDCYRTTTCTFDYTLTNDTELAYNCPLDIAYWIDATDSTGAFKDDNWTVELTTADHAGLPASIAATIEVNSLLALNLPDAIDYGTRMLGEVSSSTTNVGTALAQRGNTRADVFVSGTAMSCDALGTLAVSTQKWSLTSVGYADTAATTLTASDVRTNRNLRLRTDDLSEASRNLYWNIAVPEIGVKGACTGANTILIAARGPILDNTSWVNTGSTIPGTLSHSQSAIIGDYIYLFGGIHTASDNVTNVIYRAPLTNPTAWVDTGATLPTNLTQSQVAIIGDYVYLFSGHTGSGGGTSNTIYRAPLSNPTAWVNTGSTLPGNLRASQAAIIGDYVYLFGGHNGSAVTNIIYRAPLTNPTAWVNTGSTLPINIGFSQTAIIGDYVYLFGGFNGAYLNTIYRAPLSNPTAWVNTGATLPGTLSHSYNVTVGDYIYILGGFNGSNGTNIIYRAPLSNPTAWVTVSETLPTTLYSSQVATIENRVYLFGGRPSLASITSNIYRADIE